MGCVLKRQLVRIYRASTHIVATKVDFIALGFEPAATDLVAMILTYSVTHACGPYY